jgi:hypothetical protein
MSTCSVIHPCDRATRIRLLTFCLLISLTTVGTLHAGDETNKATNMLNQLKQRSAADRWQRVKRQYPAETPAARPNGQTTAAQESRRGLAEDELPPSPADGFSIPRLTALPADESDDWIKPARPLIIDEAAESSSVEPAPTRVAQSTVVTTAPNNPLPASDVKSDYDGTDAVTDGSGSRMAGRTPRSPIERTMNSIDPYYDRDRDSDIRKFAIEKAKEFNIDHRQAIPYQERSFPEITLAWEATNFYYYPLYFADPALERYGHTYPRGIQPLMSIARFGTQLALLPYQMTIIPPCKHEYPLGYYRPGEYAPKLHYQIPLNGHAAVVEAAVVTGLFFAIP